MISLLAAQRSISLSFFFSGRTLFKNDPDSMEAAFGISLASLEIKSGDRIMLLGRKV